MSLVQVPCVGENCCLSTGLQQVKFIRVCLETQVFCTKAVLTFVFAPIFFIIA